jgi:hypothetical protein
MITLQSIISLAKEVESEDPIDWGMLTISEDDAYNLIALSVLEMFSEIDDPEVLLATITKLVLENFVLNMKMLEQNRRAMDGET